MNKYINYKKFLYKPIKFHFFNNNSLIINGFLYEQLIKLKKNTFFNLFDIQQKTYLIIHKTYFRTFFSIILKIIDGVSFGFKIILKLKGKGLRLQFIKARNEIGCEFLKIYLKLGYSHKLFFKLPKNIWLYLYERRRSLILYGLNYCFLRMLINKIKMYYPVNMYKVRGFFESNEILKQKKGNLKLIHKKIINKKIFFYMNNYKLKKKLIIFKNLKKNKFKKLNLFFFKNGIIY